MPCGDHFVIHKLLFRPEVALQAFLRAHDHIARIHHVQMVYRVRVIPLGLRVRTQPGRGRPMAILAGDTLSNIKRARPLRFGRVQRMAYQALLSILRFFSVEFCSEDLADAHSQFVREHTVSAGVFVFYDPGRVFVL